MRAQSSRPAGNRHHHIGTHDRRRVQTPTFRSSPVRPYRRSTRAGSHCARAHAHPDTYRDRTSFRLPRPAATLPARTSRFAVGPASARTGRARPARECRISGAESKDVSSGEDAPALRFGRSRCCLAKEAASSVSEAAASLFGCSGRAFRAANRLGVCAAPEQDCAAAIYRWCAGGNRCRHRSYRAGRIAAFVMAALAVDARRWMRLAARSGVGARSEDQVRRVLGGLEAEGWRLRHSLPWGGRGDIDSVAIAPTGIAFAIESKTRTFDARHLAHARQTAAWLYRHRRRWCRRGALPVLCVVRARGLEGVEDGVLVVSLDRLVSVLRAGAGTSPRPGFLAS